MIFEPYLKNGGHFQRRDLQCTFSFPTLTFFNPHSTMSLQSDSCSVSPRLRPRLLGSDPNCEGEIDLRISMGGNPDSYSERVHSLTQPEYEKTHVDPPATSKITRVDSMCADTDELVLRTTSSPRSTSPPSEVTQKDSNCSADTSDTTRSCKRSYAETLSEQKSQDPLPYTLRMKRARLAELPLLDDDLEDAANSDGPGWIDQLWDEGKFGTMKGIPEDESEGRVVTGGCVSRPDDIGRESALIADTLKGANEVALAFLSRSSCRPKGCDSVGTQGPLSDMLDCDTDTGPVPSPNGSSSWRRFQRYTQEGKILCAPIPAKPNNDRFMRTYHCTSCSKQAYLADNVSIGILGQMKSFGHDRLCRLKLTTGGKEPPTSVFGICHGVPDDWKSSHVISQDKLSAKTIGGIERCRWHHRDNELGR